MLKEILEENLQLEHNLVSFSLIDNIIMRMTYMNLKILNSTQPNNAHQLLITILFYTQQTFEHTYYILR